MSGWLTYLKSIGTPTLANGIELLGVRPNHEGYTPITLRCLSPSLAACAAMR